MSDIKVAVDFDGVLHSYTTKWKAPHIVPDPPVKGAIDWLNHIRFGHGNTFTVFIFTTRAQTHEGIVAVRKWLQKWGAIGAESIVITNQKLAASVYIDDRGYRFTGDNFPSAETIQSLERWGHKTVVEEEA